MQTNRAQPTKQPAPQPPQPPQSKIFFLEFLVDYVNVWKLPDDLVDNDETSIDFTYRDMVQVSMAEPDFGLDCGHHGRNCLFTLQEPPLADDHVLMSIYN